MDEYGFLAVAKAGLRTFEQCCRQSGRTSRMIERVTDDDRIVCSTKAEADRVRSLLIGAGKGKTQVFTLSPKEVPMRRLPPSSRGRTFFDHGWVYEFVLRSIEGAEHDLESFQRETSKTWPEKPTEQPAFFCAAFGPKDPLF